MIFFFASDGPMECDEDDHWIDSFLYKRLQSTLTCTNIWRKNCQVSQQYFDDFFSKNIYSVLLFCVRDGLVAQIAIYILSCCSKLTFLGSKWDFLRLFCCNLKKICTKIGLLYTNKGLFEAKFTYLVQKWALFEHF